MRIRYNNAQGTLGAPLSSGAVTITFAVVPGFATLVAPDTITLTLDPNTTSEEIVTLTAYTAGDLTGVITRGAEGSAAQSHPLGALWMHGPTVLDFTTLALQSAVDAEATARVAAITGAYAGFAYAGSVPVTGRHYGAATVTLSLPDTARLQIGMLSTATLQTRLDITGQPGN